MRMQARVLSDPEAVEADYGACGSVGGGTKKEGWGWNGIWVFEGRKGVFENVLTGTKSPMTVGVCDLI